MIIGIFASGGFVIPYSLARRLALEKLGLPKYEILAVSFVNGLSLLGVFLGSTCILYHGKIIWLFFSMVIWWYY